MLGAACGTKECDEGLSEMTVSFAEVNKSVQVKFLHVDVFNGNM